MALTLNGTLQTAQNGVSHRPIVNLVTSPMESMIPLRGNYFNTDSTTEKNQDLILLSTGRLANIYVRDEILYYYYTNTDRTLWATPVNLNIDEVNHASICEMANGNIGIIIVRNSETEVGRMVISPTGSIVTAYANIQTGLAWAGAPTVIKLANDTYLLIYPTGDDEPPGDLSTENYYLQKRTSSNFTSWSSATALTLSGLNILHYKNNPDLLQLTGSRIYLHFDYLTGYENNIELNNIYVMISDDNGLTWGNPLKVTNYTTYGVTALNPTAEENDSGDMVFVYQEENTVMHYYNMDGAGAVDWVGNEIAYDPAQQLLIMTNHDLWYTNPSIVAINTETNSFIRHWDSTTSPSTKGDVTTMFNDHEACKYPFYLFRADGGGLGSGMCDDAIQVLNYETNIITKYHTGINFNINRIGKYGYDHWGDMTPFVRFVDGERRLYIAYRRTDYSVITGPAAFLLGYIDLDEIKDPITGQYVWNEEMYIGYNESSWSWNIGEIWWEESIQRYILLHYSNDYYSGDPDNYGGIMIMNEDGSIVQEWNHGSNPGLPIGGAYRGLWMQGDQVSGNIWFTFKYWGSYPDRRGLCRFNLDTNVFTYYEPDWFEANDYALSSLYKMDDDRILMTCSVSGCDKGGVVIFNTSTLQWTHYSEDTLPGMFYDIGYEQCSKWSNSKVVVAYDESTGTIYAANEGENNPIGGQRQGVIYFSELGAYSIIKYAEVTSIAGSPVYGSTAQLSFSQFERNPSLIIDPDDYMWLTWNHKDSQSEDSLIWVNTMASLNVSDYIEEKSGLIIDWAIDKPNKLTFTLAKGHLFDPLNYSSLWSIYFKMGRVVTLQLGENISDTDYLQNQGTFLVKETALKYSKGYPSIKVVAEDMRTLWENTHIVASAYNSGVNPKTVTENLLYYHGDLTNYDIPTYVGSHDLYHQFIDMDLDEAIQLILDHFGYHPFVNVAGVFQPRQIVFTGSPDHIYTDSKIVEYTPDSKYATFTNRVIVTGMSNLYSEVLYNEESITSITGTVGWWGHDKERTIYYSEDRQKVCRNPRLEVIQSVAEFQVWGIKGGGSEQITIIATDETWFIIEIDAPNLVGILIAAVVALVSLGVACIPCSTPFGGWCGACIFGITVLLNLILMLLGAVANYNYNIWARPLGHERATFQAQADDIDFQQQLNGKIITEIIDDPFCYTIHHCINVADFEIEVIKAQRKRLKLQKIGHLQDEVGDILRFNHPFSGENMDVLVTNLKRSVKFGKQASIIDHIEGWRLS